MSQASPPHGYPFASRVAYAATLAGVVLVAASPCQAEGRLTNTVRAEAGLGYDTNPFLAPDAPYFDQNRREEVDPVRQPGFFIPIRLNGGIVLPLGQRGHRFVTGYRTKGNFYTADATSAADETWIMVEPGFVFDLGVGSNRSRSVDVRAFGSYNRELFFDRDTGLPSTSSGFDVSDRYNYRAYGVELEFDYELTKSVRLVVEGLAEHRNYDDPELVEAFDHDRVGADVGVILRVTSDLRVYLSYGRQNRDFYKRRARSSDGDNDVPGNPTLTYRMDAVEGTVRYRPWRPLWLELIYTHATRTDTFVNYNDFAQDSLRIRGTYKKGRTQLRLTLKSWERDFANAFIFDKPVDPMTGGLNPTKHFDSIDVHFQGYFPLHGPLRLFAEVRYRDEQATDPRFDHERSRLMAGVEWAY